MKQKYTIYIDKDSKLVIREYAELNKDVLSMLCEEAYDDSSIKTAISMGKQALYSTIRTTNLFPPSTYIDEIAEAIIGLYRSGNNQAVDLNFNDINMLSPDQPREVVEIHEESDEDIDEIFEDGDSDFNDDIEIRGKISSIKIADADTNEADDDSSVS